MRLAVILGLLWTLLPLSAAAQTSGFVYALTDVLSAPNRIHGFAVDASTGALTALPGFPINTDGHGGTQGVAEYLTYDPVRNRLFAINVGSQSVSVFEVNRVTGALTLASFSPIPLGDHFPACFAVSPDGSVLVTGGSTSNETLEARAFNLSANAATPAPGSPYTTGSAWSFSCAFTRDGARFYTGGNFGSMIAGFAVDAGTAALTPLPGSPFNMGHNNPIAYATDQLERLFTASFLFPGDTSFGDGNLRVYSTTGGTPVLLGSPVPTGQTGQVHGLLHPAGFYITTGREAPSSVGVFRVAGTGAGTTLTAVAPPVATNGQFSSASVVDATGRVLVTVNAQSRNLTSFRFDPSSGVLTQAVVLPPNTLGSARTAYSLAFAPIQGATTNPPTITPIPNQSLPHNGSVTVPFTIGGAIITSALRVSLTSSNPTLLPVTPSTLRSTCASSGACTLFIQPADGRFGTATVTVTVSDGFLSTSTSFTVTVAAGAPTAPNDVLSTPVGSGFVMTWNPPATGTPLGYAVSWGTANGASNLPVQLVPFNRFEVTATPPGTYFLRVYAVGEAQLSPASFQTQVIVTSNPAIPGPPLGLEATADAQSLTGLWRTPLIGGPPSIYEVQVGTGVGLNDVASPTTATLSQRTPVQAGSYWIRSRAAAGGNAGPWTSSVQIPVAPGPCTSAPGTPTLLPVTTTTGLVTFNWVAFGAAADRFEVELATGLGLPAIATLPTTGPGSSLVWPHTGSGTGAARVVAINSCGRSTRSNEVGFTLQ